LKTSGSYKNPVSENLSAVKRYDGPVPDVEELSAFILPVALIAGEGIYQNKPRAETWIQASSEMPLLLKKIMPHP
jgi:hypothetical protein